FNYLEIVAQQHRLPSAAERAQAISHHPPLHYILASPVYAATARLSRDAQWHAVRLWNVVLGGVTLIFVYLTLSTLFPNRPRVSGFGLIFVGWLPHYQLISAMHSNDIAAVLFSTITFYLVARIIAGETQWYLAAGAGLMAGAAVLCKHNALLAVFPAGIMAAVSPFFRSAEFEEKRGWTTPLQQAGRIAGALGGAFLMTGGAWLARFYLQWGRLDSDVAWSASQWPVHTFGGKLLWAISGLYRSTWSQVGWLPGMHSSPPLEPSTLYPRPPVETPLLLLAFPVALLGLIGTITCIARWCKQAEKRWKAAGGLLLVAAWALTYAALLHNAMYANPGRFEGGRYALPAVAATMSLMAVGPLALPKENRKIAWWWAAGLLLVMNAVAFYEMFAYLIPTFA
ncbi:MAG: glycosyltransferase family 39 protein, partial [Armatimonadota bacterium]